LIGPILSDPSDPSDPTDPTDPTDPSAVQQKTADARWPFDDS
jgi:hypothetical protein